MNRLPIGLFVATVIALTITHIVHLKDVLLDHGSLGRVHGEGLTRAALCVPIFLVASFVALSRRFARHGRWWGIGTLAITVAVWADLLISN
jgi:hypothetical protein